MRKQKQFHNEYYSYLIFLKVISSINFFDAFERIHNTTTLKVKAQKYRTFEITKFQYSMELHMNAIFYNLFSIRTKHLIINQSDKNAIHGHFYQIICALFISINQCSHDWNSLEKNSNFLLILIVELTLLIICRHRHSQ